MINNAPSVGFLPAESAGSKLSHSLAHQHVMGVLHLIEGEGVEKEWGLAPPTTTPLARSSTGRWRTHL